MRIPGLLKLTSIVALSLAAMPASATIKYVHFSFTVSGTAAHGTYTLDCPTLTGSCAVTSLDGFFGPKPIELAPIIPLPSPPPPVVAPDNTVTQPGFAPSAQGVGFSTITELPGGGFHTDSFFDVFTELTIDGGATWIPYDPGTGDPTGDEVNIDDYETSVPEPASWLMMIAGFGVVGLAQRGRRLSRNLPLRISS